MALKQKKNRKREKYE
jgi:hypothetical protein